MCSCDGIVVSKFDYVLVKPFTATYFDAQGKQRRHLLPKKDIKNTISTVNIQLPRTNNRFFAIQI